MDKTKQPADPVFEGEVLLCEDNKMNQQMICTHFTRSGLKTVVAENGREGVDILKRRIEKGEKTFDLIFMDINMPLMGGLEALKEIMKLNVKIPVIAITADAMPDEKEHYLASGMSGHINKPFTSKELRRLLSEYLTPVNEETINRKERTQPDEKLRSKLIYQFVRNNQKKYDEIVKAIEENDVKLAYRLAHSLKTNAAMLDKTGLQKAAEDVEILLKDEKNRLTPGEMNVLETELTRVLEEFAPLAAEMAKVRAIVQTDFMDEEAARLVIKELETLLAEGNLACLKLIDKVRLIPESEKLIEEIENFEFDAALLTLVKLKKENS